MRTTQDQYYPAIPKERVLSVEADTITIKQYNEILDELSERWNFIIRTVAKVVWWDFGNAYNDHNGEYLKSLETDGTIFIQGDYAIESHIISIFLKVGLGKRILKNNILKRLRTINVRHIKKEKRNCSRKRHLNWKNLKKLKKLKIN